MKPGTIAQAFETANARSEARMQTIKDSSEAAARLITLLVMKTIVLAGVGALTYACGPAVGLGTLAVVYFFFS